MGAGIAMHYGGNLEQILCSAKFAYEGAIPLLWRHRNVSGELLAGNKLPIC